MAQAAPVRRSRLRSASVASLSEAEVDGPRRLRRRGSGGQLPVVGEGSNASLSGVEEGAPRRLRRRGSGSQLSILGEGSNASLSEAEVDGPRRLRRRGSGGQLSIVGEGSNSLKRKRSPPEEGAIPSKRPRTTESNSAQTMETIQEEATTVPGESGRDITYQEARQEQGDLVSHGCLHCMQT